MQTKILILFLALASVFTQTARAQDKFPSGDFKELREAGTVKIASIIDPQTIQLVDGRVVRLAGVDFPDLSVHEAGEISLMATEILRDMLAGQDVTLYQTQKKDWGRLNSLGHHIAQLERKSDGTWIQGTLLELGLARAMTSQRNPEMAAQMFVLEQKARESGLGLWAEGGEKILSADETAEHLESLQIVEGKVVSVGLKSNWLYLNFGQDWRKDFTISISPEDKRAFSRAGLDPMQWGGKTLRARGWLRSYNGPYMEIDHPQGVEIIENAAALPTEEAEEQKNSALPPLHDAVEVPKVRAIRRDH